MYFNNISIRKYPRLTGDNCYGELLSNNVNCNIVIIGDWTKINNIEDYIPNIISHEVLDNLVGFRHNANIHATLNGIGYKACAANKFVNPSGIVYRTKARKALGLNKRERL